MTTAQAIQRTFESPNEMDRNGEEANVVDGLFAIARALDGVRSALHYLGNGNSGTELGAIEALGVIFRDGMSKIAAALSRDSETL